MAWPTTSVLTGELITAAQLNLLPVRLADTTVSGAAVASIDLTSIPTIYAHLEVFVEARSDNAGGLLDLQMRLNNDSTANYESEYIEANATSLIAAEQVPAETSGRVGRVPGAGAASAAYSGSCVIWLPNYASTSFRKRWLSQWSTNTDAITATIRTGSVGGYYNVSNAISRITILASSGSLIAGSRVTVYGRP